MKYWTPADIENYHARFKKEGPRFSVSGLPRPRIVVGIDPGKCTGLAIYSRATRKLIELRTLTFWDVLEYITEHFRPEHIELVIEDPTDNKPVFAKRGDDTSRKRLHIAQGVGSVKREAQLLIEGFRRRGYTVTTITPKEKKWSNETFRQITSHEGPASEHARDAARLVWGM